MIAYTSIQHIEESLNTLKELKSLYEKKVAAMPQIPLDQAFNSGNNNLILMTTAVGVTQRAINTLEELLKGNSNNNNNQLKLIKQLTNSCNTLMKSPFQDISEAYTTLSSYLNDRNAVLERNISKVENKPITRDVSIDDFKFIKPISKGAYGRVYLVAKISTGDVYALKVMDKSQLLRKNQVASIKAEQKILAEANNPFVVKMYWSFQTKEHLFLVMEFVNGGDLYSLLQNVGTLSEDVVRQYISFLIIVLCYFLNL